MNLFLSQLDGAVLIDAILKTLLVVALAGFFAAMLRKRAASTRHAIWLAATVVLITLPMAAVVMPKLSLPLLPAEPNLVSNEVASTPLEIELSQSPAVAPLATPEAPVVAAWSWSKWALLVWGAGAFVVLARLVVGFVRLDRLCRCAHVVNDPDWQAAVEQAKQQTGVRRDVRLLKSPHAKVPMTWGLWRIDVCLPMHAIDWSATNRRIVLTHELTHVRRGDWLWQVLSIAMTAAHWFNPLAWWAAHRLRMEAENACDDAVIERGCTPSDYADCLYQMVRAAKAAPVRLSPAMTMARPSELPWRLSMILDDKTRRHETRFRTLVLTLVASAVLGSVFAAAQVGRAQNELPPSEKKQKTEPGQRPVDLSMIQRAVSRGRITAKQGKQVLEFSKLREASKIGDLAPQDHLSPDHLSPDIASRLEKLGITWAEGEALLIKTQKAAYITKRVVFAHLEEYDASTNRMMLVTDATVLRNSRAPTWLTLSRSTRVSDDKGKVEDLVGRDVLVITEDDRVVSVDDNGEGALKTLYGMGVSGEALGRIRTELGRIGIDVQRIGAVEGVLTRLIAGMPENGEMDPRLRKYLEDQIGLDEDQIEGLQDLASRLAAGSNPLRRLGVSDEALGPMTRDLEKKMGIERGRILAALGMVRHMIGREPDEDVRLVLEKRLELTERQIDSLQEFANQFRDLEPEEIAVAREFYELREVVIKAERNFLIDEERRRLKELGITWKEGETLLKRAEREYRGDPFAKGGRLNRG